MSHRLARIAIEKKLQSWATSNNVKAIFGIQKSYPANPVYFHGYLLPATTTAPYLHADGLEYTGIYQVSIVCDPSQPESVPETYVDGLSTLFMVDSIIEQGVFSGIIIEPADRGPTITDESKYTVPVSIRYRGRVELT